MEKFCEKLEFFQQLESSSNNDNSNVLPKRSSSSSSSSCTLSTYQNSKIQFATITGKFQSTIDVVCIFCFLHIFDQKSSFFLNPE